MTGSMAYHGFLTRACAMVLPWAQPWPVPWQRDGRLQPVGRAVACHGLPRQAPRHATKNSNNVHPCIFGTYRYCARQYVDLRAGVAYNNGIPVPLWLNKGRPVDKSWEGPLAGLLLLVTATPTFRQWRRPIETIVQTFRSLGDVCRSSRPACTSSWGSLQHLCSVVIQRGLM